MKHCGNNIWNNPFTVFFFLLPRASKRTVLVRTMDEIAVLQACSHSVGDAYISSFLPSSLFLSPFSVTRSSCLNDVICTQFDRTIRVIEVCEKCYPSMFFFSSGRKKILHTTRWLLKLPPLMSKFRSSKVFESTPKERYSLMPVGPIIFQTFFLRLHRWRLFLVCGFT